MKGNPFRFVATAIALLILLGILMACGGAATPQPAAPPAAVATAPPSTGGSGQQVDLKWVVWSYGIETILDNIKKFEALTPGVKVALQDFSWLDYHDIIVQRYASNTQTDLLYSSDHWLQEWVDAGWLEPMDTHWPEVADYVKDMAPYAQEGVTYKGHVYGLPYYASTFTFVYNEEQIKKAGFDKPPATWEELTVQAKAIKDKGINNYPVFFALSQKESASIESFYTMVYSRADAAGSMFDKDNNPTLNQAGGPAFQTVSWIADSMQKDKILDPASLQATEIDQVKGLQSGEHTFTIFPSSNQAELNKVGSGPNAGKFKMALMPGKSHYSVGYVRFYSISGTLPKRGQAAMDAAWKFMTYFGGKTNGEYTVVKRWAVENGLGFAQMPIFNDPDVQKAWNAWGDTALLQEQSKLARAKEGLTPYFGEWDVFARAELHKAYLGQETPQAALDNMAKKWNDLKNAK